MSDNLGDNTTNTRHRGCAATSGQSGDTMGCLARQPHTSHETFMIPFATRSPYPRDLVGYGRTPPDPRWPDGARIAVQFVINYEEGGENCILHGDNASEAFLSEIVGAQPWPGQRHMSMESIYEYGSRAGFCSSFIFQ